MPAHLFTLVYINKPLDEGWLRSLTSKGTFFSTPKFHNRCNPLTKGNHSSGPFQTPTLFMAKYAWHMYFQHGRFWFYIQNFHFHTSMSVEAIPRQTLFEQMVYPKLIFPTPRIGHLPRPLETSPAYFSSVCYSRPPFSPKTRPIKQRIHLR